MRGHKHAYSECFCARPPKRPGHHRERFSRLPNAHLAMMMLIMTACCAWHVDQSVRNLALLDCGNRWLGHQHPPQAAATRGCVNKKWSALSASWATDWSDSETQTSPQKRVHGFCRGATPIAIPNVISMLRETFCSKSPTPCTSGPRKRTTATSACSSGCNNTRLQQRVECGNALREKPSFYAGPM